jgi:hypothetical protein
VIFASFQGVADEVTDSDGVVGLLSLEPPGQVAAPG